MENRYIVVNDKLIPEDTAEIVIGELLKGKNEVSEHLLFPYEEDNPEGAVKTIEIFMSGKGSTPFTSEFIIEMAGKMVRINAYGSSVLNLEMYRYAGVLIIRKSDF